jgi:hypothetical protein
VGAWNTGLIGYYTAADCFLGASDFQREAVGFDAAHRGARVGYHLVS